MKHHQKYTAQLACGKIRTVTIASTRRFRRHLVTRVFCDECWSLQEIVNILDWPEGTGSHASGH